MTLENKEAVERGGFRDRHAGQIRSLRLYVHTLSRSFASMIGLTLVLLLSVVRDFETTGGLN